MALPTIVATTVTQSTAMTKLLVAGVVPCAGSDNGDGGGSVRPTVGQTWPR